MKNDASCIDNVCRDTGDGREIVLRSTMYYDVVSDSEEWQRQNQRAQLAAQAPQLWRDLAEAVAMLRERQFDAYNPTGYDALDAAECQSCGGNERHGHKPDCKLAAFLARHP